MAAETATALCELTAPVSGTAEKATISTPTVRVCEGKVVGRARNTEKECRGFQREGGAVDGGGVRGGQNRRVGEKGSPGGLAVRGRMGDWRGGR